MREKQFDYVFSFFPGRINTILFLFSKKLFYAGFWNVSAKINWWLNNSEKGIAKKNIRKRFLWNSTEPYLQRIVKSLEAVEISCTNVQKPIFNIILENRRVYEDYILLHFHSRQKERSLNTETIINIIYYLHQRYKCNIKIMVWNAEVYQVKSIVSSMKFVEIIENASLDTITVLIFYAKIFLGIESFPIHIADAYNTNFIGIFGKANPKTALQHYQKSIEFPMTNLQDISSDHILNALTTVLV